MSKEYDEISPVLSDWIKQQHVFFVATAPLAANGLLNCSPKGMDTFRILGPEQVAYLDLTGSGIETIAHIRENGRIVFMFCALTGAPKIVRLHGIGEVVTPASSGFDQLQSCFPKMSGARAIIRVNLTRIGDSCGFGVPRYDYIEDRDGLVKWAESKGDAVVRQYRREKNSLSLDGLPALEPLASIEAI